MRKNNTLNFLLILFCICSGLQAVAQVPDNLTSTRCAVVVSIPEMYQNGYSVRGDWKKFALDAHKSFKKIGVDGIIYIYEDDLKAGPEVTKAYKDLLEKRDISNILSLSHSGDESNPMFEIGIYPIKEKLDLNNPYYSISSASLRELMLILGRQVLRQEIPRTNFLIPDQPEFLDDLNLYTGTRYVNVPSRLKSLGIAVIKFDSVKINDGLSERDIEKLRQKNAEVAAANRQLDSIMQQYPFQYELVNFTSIEDLYKTGYQYALMPLISSGRTIKQMLNYPTAPSETVYISEISKKGEKPVLKRIPANGNMAKFYIKQTIVMDVHVGSRWDADATWQKALVNFIENIKFDFNVK
ncbi:MAG: hypothetical protein ABJG41_07445 [Cyclobacteriaceae bacterium]